MFCDSLTYDADLLDGIVRRLGDGQVLLGTDYPFIAREQPTGAVLAERPELRCAVGRANAMSLIDAVAAVRRGRPRDRA